MTDEEYQETQSRVTMISNLIETTDLSGFLERISTAQTLGPIMDPTLWMRAESRLGLLEDVAQALATAQSSIRSAMKNYHHRTPRASQAEELT